MLVRVEVVHLAVFALALAIAGTVSFAALVGVASAGSVVAVLGYHVIATRTAGVRLWRPLWGLAVVSLAAIVGLATRVGPL